MSPSTPSHLAPGAPLTAGMSDVAAEHLFYETVLAWDPTQPRDALDDDSTAAPPPSSASSSSPPSPPPPTPPLATFPGGAAYQAFFRPLLLLDFLSQLQQSYEANLTQPHSLAAQLQPLTVTSVEERDGRGASQSMFTVHLLHVNDEAINPLERRRKQGQMRDWVAGDLALLRHHVGGDKRGVEGGEEGREVKGKQRRREREKKQRASLGRVDHFVMCVIDNVESAFGRDGNAPLYAVRVRVHLPLTAATPPRARAMWEALHPKMTMETDEKQRDRPRASYEGVYSVVRLESPVTTAREFIALQLVDSLSLLPHLLNPVPSWSTPSMVTSAPLLEPSTGVSADGLHSFTSSLPEQYRGYLSTHLNAYQLQAVQLSAFRCRQPGFTLLQGPPGTGKTKTVVSILNTLHLRAYQSHYSSLIRALLAVPKSVLASLRRGPAAGDTASQPITVDDLIFDLTAPPSSSSTSASTSSSPFPSSAIPRILPKPRILVCAPSNAGVDEIITRVLGVESSTTVKGGFVDGALVRYSPDIVRIGQSESVREEVKEKISLDVLVDGYMKLTAEQLEARARHASRARVDTKRELDQWVQTYRRRWEAAVKQGDPRAPEPEPSEVVEPHFLSAIAHLHERLHLATLDADRCQSILSLYHSSSNSHTTTALPSTSAPPALSRERRAAALDRLRLSFLNEAHIVFSTLSGAGLPILSSSLSHPFSALLVDEAAQATELSTLVAFRHNVAHVILVGDPKQLPATVFLHREVRARQAIERSLFERLQGAGQEVQTLVVQYRMHREIRSFPSRFFYEDRLVDGEVVGSAGYVKEFHRHPLCRPMLLFDVRLDEYERAGEREEVQRVHAQFPLDRGKSSGNVTEAAFVARMVELLLTLYPTEVRGASIGIITFYQQQKKILEQMMADMRSRVAGMEGVEVSTVDGFQGREKEVIIVSCVRQRRGGGGGRGKVRKGIGFVSDIRRMNVALTRGKWAMWVCGDVEVLSEGSVEWKALVEDARSRGLVKRWRDVRNEDARWLPFQRVEPSRGATAWKSTQLDGAGVVGTTATSDDPPPPPLERVAEQLEG